MENHRRILLPLLTTFVLILQLRAFGAEPSPCIVGEPDKREAETALKNSPGFQEFLRTRSAPGMNPFNSPSDKQICIDPPRAGRVAQANVMSDTARELMRTFEPVRKSCIVGSLQREATNAETDPKTKRSTNSICQSDDSQARDIKPAQCYTQDMIDYLHHRFNSAALCVHSLMQDIPFRAEHFFRVINTESAFKFYAYGKQRGLGQLTGDAVRDIYDPNSAPGKWHQQLLAEAERSNNPACNRLKEISRKDRAEVRSGQLIPLCRFNSADDGLDRNLYYSMIYYTGVRQRLIGEITERCREYVPDMQIGLINSLAYIGYGDGPTRASAITRGYDCRPGRDQKPLDGAEAYYEEQLTTNHRHLALNNKFAEVQRNRRRTFPQMNPAENCTGYDDATPARNRPAR